MSLSYYLGNRQRVWSEQKHKGDIHVTTDAGMCNFKCNASGDIPL